MSSTRQPAATPALIRSRPLTYRYLRASSVHVAVPQTAPFDSRKLILLSLGLLRYLIVLSLLIAMPTYAPLVIAQQPAVPATAQSPVTSPPPKTRLEQFQVKTGSVLIKGYTDVGTAAGKYGSTVSVSAMEFTDASSGGKQFGIAIEIKGSGQYPQTSRSYIDLDEVDSLLKGIDYISHADKSVTKLASFEAIYRTKGDFVMNVFGSGHKGTMLAVESGRFGTASAYFDIAELPKVRQLIEKAQAALQSIK
jgi:hypothetical protein